MAPQPLPASPPTASYDWRALSKADLDRAYNQAAYAANRDQLLVRFAQRSESAREVRGQPVRHRYGPSELEALDIFRADADKAPIQIFIHGGAWRSGHARDCAFFSELFLDAGAHLVVPDFVDAVTAGGDLQPMVDQVLRAITWVFRNAQAFGGDPGKIYLSGTSSGAHLAAVALTTDLRRHALPERLFKAGLLCSGIYDLDPVRHSARGDYLRLTDAAVHALSPIRHIENLRTPLVVACGSLETPEFLRQARDFAEAARRAGCLQREVLVTGYNHFEIHETLGDPYGALGRAVLAQMAGDLPPFPSRNFTMSRS